MSRIQSLWSAIGREEGCRQISREFYARVATDPVLRPLFPGKLLRCATEELAAFLVQFFDGDENQMQKRWWLSLQESHARFSISEAQRTAWLGHMNATLESLVTDSELQVRLRSFFEVVSTYVVSSDLSKLADPDLDGLWQRQLSLDRLIGAIVIRDDAEAIALAKLHLSRRSVTVGILARFMASAREPLIGFTLDSLSSDKQLVEARFNGRSLLHFAAGSGRISVVEALLGMAVDPNVLDAGSHTPLYRVANECRAEAGPRIVHTLARAGATIDHAGGVTRSTALHAAARRGFLSVAMALIDEGASVEVRDYKGFTPLDRARNCRRSEVATALERRKQAQ